MQSKVRLRGIVAAGVLSLAGSLVAFFEGRSLVAYLDPVGVPTICEGVTRGVKLGDVATNAQCDAALQKELILHLKGVEACINGYLTPNQWAAVVSWTYNVGVGAACGSTLVSRINAGEPPSLWCPELKRWVYAGGRKLQGLVNRRAKEYDMCMVAP